MDKCALYKNQNYDKGYGSYSAMGDGHLKDNALGKCGKAHRKDMSKKCDWKQSAYI